MRAGNAQQGVPAGQLLCALQVKTTESRLLAHVGKVTSNSVPLWLLVRGRSPTASCFPPAASLPTAGHPCSQQRDAAAGPAGGVAGCQRYLQCHCRHRLHGFKCGDRCAAVPGGWVGLDECLNSWFHFPAPARPLPRVKLQSLPRLNRPACGRLVQSCSLAYACVIPYFPCLQSIKL